MASEAYEKALRDGSMKVYYGRILLIGQDRAGKTSLKKSLIGLPFNPDEPSTQGIDVDPSNFEVDVNQVKNWQSVGKNKEGLLGRADHIAKVTIENLPHKTTFTDFEYNKSEQVTVYYYDDDDDDKQYTQTEDEGMNDEDKKDPEVEEQDEDEDDNRNEEEEEEEEEEDDSHMKQVNQ